MKQAQNKEDRFEQAAFEQAVHGFAQSTEVVPVFKFRQINPEADDYVDPNAPNDEFLKGQQPIEMEVVSTQEGEEAEKKVKSKTEVPLLNLTEKETFYKIAIDRDEKLILSAKERIKYNKIRLRKLQAYISGEQRRKEKALMEF